MAHICIVYSTTDGHTLKICQRMRQVLERTADQVHLLRKSFAIVERHPEVAALVFYK